MTTKRLTNRRRTGGATLDISRDDTTEEAVGLANSFKPSAMGISFLAEISDNDLIVEISAGKYKTETTTVDGREKRRYPRTAILSRVVLAADELKGEAAKIFRRDVLSEDGNPTGLEIFVLSRPENVGESGAERRLITISLINKSITEGEKFVTDKCFFQVSFAVTSSDAKDCFIEYPEKKGESLDDEELALRLLYRHRKTFAVGHGCAADWEETGERAFSVSTAVLPVYDVKPIVPNILPDLTLSMLELSDLKNEINPLETLRALCDKYEDWIKNAKKKPKILTSFGSRSRRAFGKLPPMSRTNAKRHFGSRTRQTSDARISIDESRDAFATTSFRASVAEEKKDESKVCSLPPVSFS